VRLPLDYRSLGPQVRPARLPQLPPRPRLHGQQPQGSHGPLDPRLYARDLCQALDELRQAL
jgi:hypothetical protein